MKTKAAMELIAPHQTKPEHTEGPEEWSEEEIFGWICLPHTRILELNINVSTPWACFISNDAANPQLTMKDLVGVAVVR